MARPRRLAALILLAVLSVPAAWGRPLQPSTGGVPPTPSGRLLVFLSSWLSRTLPADWLKEGCKIDPAGHCAPFAQIESGCILDPAGHCAPASHLKEGCMVDPAGRCLAGGH